MHFLCQAGIVAAAFEPTSAWMVLHSRKLGVLVLQPDFHFFHSGELLFGQEDADPLKVVGEHLNCFFTLFGVFAPFKKGGIHVNCPAFDVFLDGFNPADFFRLGFFFFVTKGKPRGGGEDDKWREEF